MRLNCSRHSSSHFSLQEVAACITSSHQLDKWLVEYVYSRKFLLKNGGLWSACFRWLSELLTSPDCVLELVRIHPRALKCFSSVSTSPVIQSRGIRRFIVLPKEIQSGISMHQMHQFSYKSLTNHFNQICILLGISGTKSSDKIVKRPLEHSWTSLFAKRIGW